MNRFERNFSSGREAEVRFLDGDFKIVKPGDFVRCAVTSEAIPLGELKYWDVENQEAYVNAEVSCHRYRELTGR